jgi:hypothetical protein
MSGFPGTQGFPSHFLDLAIGFDLPHTTETPILPDQHAVADIGRWGISRHHYDLGYRWPA